MQITLNQQEIETAIVEFVSKQITITGQVEVNLTAGRGANGLSATIDITNLDTTVKPVKRVDVDACINETNKAAAAATPETDEKELPLDTEESVDEEKSLFGNG